MTSAERMLLLLCAELEDGERPLSPSQQQLLHRRLLDTQLTAAETALPLDEAALRRLGYGEGEAGRILALLARGDALDAWLRGAARHRIGVVTLHSPEYPQALRQKLGIQAPPLLFYRGDPWLLKDHLVSLVGSRRLEQTGREFAERVGLLAAREGYTLVSGNAPGADQCAQQTCLANGGRVIAVVADSLIAHPTQANVLLLSEDGWDLPFSALRALRRNRIIHALGGRILVAQTDCGVGGTWNGTTDALRLGLGPVFVCDDGSEGAFALANRGATPIRPEELYELSTLHPRQRSFFEECEKKD